MVPSRRLLTPLVSLVALCSLAGVTTAQTAPDAPQLSPLVRLTIALVVNGLVGAIVVSFAPDYTRAVVDDIRDDPAVSFIWGLIAGIGGAIAIVILAITIIGLLVAIPGIFVYLFVAIVGGAVGTVALGAVLADQVTDSTLSLALVVGVVVSSLLSITPLVGPLVNWLVSTVGIGAVVNRYWTQRKESEGSDRRRATDTGGVTDF